MWRKKRVMKGEELACSSPMSKVSETLDAAEKEYGDNGYSRHFQVFLSFSGHNRSGENG